MPNLVGLGNEQVPTNAMLGGLAYQDPAHTNLTNVEIENIAPIKAKISKTAAPNESIFIYETKNDSDGGAWRKRCTGKSWNLETLGTQYRGTRKEFPAVAVIVATTTEIIIYDGDDPNMSMWMVFKIQNDLWAKHTAASATKMCVHALNGVLCTGSDGGRLCIVNFPADRGTVTESGYTYQHSRISERNSEGVGPHDGASISIRNNYISDVSMTVLENAVVDTETGLPIPTIAVAVDTGLSIIQIPATSNLTANTGLGKMYNIDVYCSHASHDKGLHIEFMEGGRYAFVDGSDAGPGTGNCWIKVFDSIGISNNQITVNSHTGNTQNVNAVYSVQLAGDNDLTLLGSDNGYVRAYGSGSNRAITQLAVTKDGFASGNWYGLTKIAEYPYPYERNGMTAYITNYYNTGWCFGNCQLATLASVDDTNINDNMLAGVQNSGFGGSAGWTLGSGWTITGGQAVKATSSGGYLQTSAAIFTRGESYAVTVSVAAVTGNCTCYAGPGAPGGGNHYGGFSTTGTHTIVLTAYSTAFGIWSPNGTGCTINEVWITKAEVNHHHGVSGADGNGNPSETARRGLKVNGTITKTKVATGADLVGYSGFSNSNYFRQNYGTNMVLSNGMTIMFWAKGRTSSWGQVMSRGVSDSTETFRVAMKSDTVYFDYGTGSQYCQTNRAVPEDWAFYVCTVKAGSAGRIYINGLEQSYNVQNNSSNPIPNGNTWEMCIGKNANNAGDAFPGSLALVRISGGSNQPSDEQIKKIYNDEVALFVPNAKCTLTGTQTYGASGAYDNHVIKALAYDKGTDILHVGTAGGRSDFDGLVRINSTSTAVTTAIAASNGLIVEQ